jgi:lipoprotein
MKKLMIIASLLAIACNDIEPIEIDAPKREINTQALTQYKSNLNNRPITMGMLYNWGKEAGAILMNTPDSLDVIVVKNNYNSIDEILQNDLKGVQQKKATKVLLGIDFSAATTTDTTKLTKQANDALAIAKANGFNGVSVEFPQESSDYFSKAAFDAVLSAIVTNKGNLLFAVENMYGEYGLTSEEKPIDKANWVIFRKKDNELFSSFTDQAEKWTTLRYLPSTDFSEEGLEDGYTDSANFNPDGKDGRYPRTIDITNWKASNRAGVALYHIEKDYYNLSGKTTFKTLRAIIHKVQQ